MIWALYWIIYRIWGILESFDNIKFWFHHRKRSEDNWTTPCEESVELRLDIHFPDNYLTEPSAETAVEVILTGNIGIINLS